ncbi:polysaccharide deacetylase family protein [Carboxylicivirga caseinilyticus]|uniref:polysaccharide deacetylase family protein n=1 Tax=Carboxylicivirga caseinilyticus TaxID=3417572 RepID=UPI003D32B808|nr:polysaccharide deacetylase family protein [Marinilabiliaceae bacterium A049]
MKDHLSNNQINYVLFHLKQHVDLQLLEPLFAFGEEEIRSGTILFPCTEHEMNVFNIQFNSDVIPILFSDTNRREAYSISEGNLVFHHDFLKSAFYLLSCYQEVDSKSTDTIGRFLYKGSIQDTLNAITKPLVNYYFEIIIQGFEEFYSISGIEVKRKRLFNNYGFMLTHDVDRIDYFHWRETVYQWLQVFGFKQPHYTKNRLIKSAFKSILPTLLPGLKKDPWWNFNELRLLEKKHGLKSVWYFLNQDGSPHDAKYSLEEKRIIELISDLQDQGCEIGLHGSISTANDLTAMQNAYDRLAKIKGDTITGTRQHFLKFHYPQTLIIQEQVGLKYDTTVGFAEHEGFRNSYCYPFRPYDHKNDRMMDIWELPLNVMDGTLLGYRKLDFNEMARSIELLISEIRKFGGLFVLLWHNCNFDEYQYPGINQFYETMLSDIAKTRPDSVVGEEVLKKLS